MTWAVLDCEMIKTLEKHTCVRSMYILLENEVTNKYIEFLPCVDIKEIGFKYRRSFEYCTRYIHKLPYYTLKMSGPCYTAPTELERFIKKNNVSLIFYKGGEMEKHLCEYIGVPSYNIELLGAPKVNSHNPRDEVVAHLKYLKSNCLQRIDAYMKKLRE